KESPQAVSEAWLTLIDTQRYSEAWDRLDQRAKERFPKGEFLQLSHSLREPLGKPINRVFEGIQSAEKLPTGETGAFSGLTYDTEYSSGASRTEFVLLSSDGNNWFPWAFALYPSLTPASTEHRRQ